MSNLPPNPFDNPEFRNEFRKEMEPVKDLLARHDRDISRIKGVGTAISLAFTGLVAYIRMGK